MRTCWFSCSENQAGSRRQSPIFRSFWINGQTYAFRNLGLTKPSVLHLVLPEKYRKLLLHGSGNTPVDLPRKYCCSRESVSTSESRTEAPRSALEPNPEAKLGAEPLAAQSSPAQSRRRRTGLAWSRAVWRGSGS